MPHTISTAYISAADLTSLLPAAFVTEALDDDEDGTADAAVLESVLIMASNMVDAYLEARYYTPVPKATAPATILAAAVHFAIGILYGRRGMEEKNPYKVQLKDAIAILTRVRAGTEDLDLIARVPEDQEPVQVLFEQAIAVGRDRLNF